LANYKRFNALKIEVFELTYAKIRLQLKGRNMSKYYFLIAALYLFGGAPSLALEDFDAFVLKQCSDECNGETADCRICYNNAVDLYDQENPDSPEVDFDINYHEGTLELQF